jgi:PadR family transcriptional regulator PadR
MNDRQREVLGALISGPGYGLEILDRVKQRGGTKLGLSSGNLYPLLRGLERDGFLTSFEGDTVPARGGRPRIYYKLTGEGCRAVLEEHGATVAGGERFVPVPT